MTLHKVFDAAHPPAVAPPWAEGVLGYVGKFGFATHVWELAEWLPFGHLRQFPAYVPALGNSPAAEAAEAVAAARSLGWAPHMPEPETRVIVLDGETSQFPAWYAHFASEVASRGFVAVDYGSLNFVTANLASDLWVADWTDSPVPVPGQAVHGDQYIAGVPFGGTEIDISTVDDWLFARGGRGPRRSIPLPGA